MLFGHPLLPGANDRTWPFCADQVNGRVRPTAAGPRSQERSFNFRHEPRWTADTGWTVTFGSTRLALLFALARLMAWGFAIG
jgi:hypothetical protein